MVGTPTLPFASTRNAMVASVPAGQLATVLRSVERQLSLGAGWCEGVSSILTAHIREPVPLL